MRGEIMRKSGNSFGFTLIELLIAVFISSLVFAGAFNIQAVFNETITKETSISNVQNNVDSLKMYFRKMIKRSGAGLTGVVAMRNCSGLYEYIPPIMIHNINSYPATSDNSLGGTDNDPDWIEFVAPDSVAVTSVEDWFQLSTRAKVYSTTDFHTRDIVALNIGNVSCLMRVNSVYNSTTIKYLTWTSRGGLYCINPSNSQHPGCLLTSKLYNPPGIINITSLGEFPFQALRVDLSNPKNPLLMHGIRMMENGGTNYTWSVIAEGIEDMQLAFHLDTSIPPDSRGEIWINSRDLLFTEYGKIRSVRVSLVARSSHPNSTVKTRRPAFEDRSQGTLDNYLRRRVSFVVNMPNKPITVGVAE
jgi:prepilin-type N-terminal cleavage/methylation domain-containing protein